METANTTKQDITVKNSATEINEGINISSTAAERIKKLMEAENDGSVLRLTIEGGGCSGFKYRLDLAKPEADDLTFENEGAIVATDNTSLEFLGGCTLHFVDDLYGSYFEVKNPNAKSNCGCGSSFGV